MSYENDLYPGEMIGDAALGGINKRLQTVVSISPCQLLMISVEDFKSVDELGSQPLLSLDDKFQFLKHVPIFHDYLDYHLCCIAQAMEVTIIAKDVIVCKKDEESNCFALIYNGKLDIVSDLDNKSPLASLQKHDYYGESSILRQRLIHSSNSSSKKSTDKKTGEEKKMPNQLKSSYHFRECFNCKAASSLEVLQLPHAYFYLVDSKAMFQLRSSYLSRMRWRGIRADGLREEKESQAKSNALLLQEGEKTKVAEEGFIFNSSSPLDLRSTFGSNTIPKKQDITYLPNINESLNPISLLATSKNAISFRKNKQMLDRIVILQQQRSRPHTATESSGSLGFASLYGNPNHTIYCDMAMEPQKLNSKKGPSLNVRSQSSPEVSLTSIGLDLHDYPESVLEGEGRSRILNTSGRPMTQGMVGIMTGSQRIPPLASYCELPPVSSLAQFDGINTNLPQRMTKSAHSRRAVSAHLLVRRSAKSRGPSS